MTTPGGGVDAGEINDVFISYSHLDNDSPSEDRVGWVSALHEALRAELPSAVGRRVRVWRDPELRGNDVFPEVLSAELNRVRILLPIISPGYQRSEWCRRELEEFLAAARTSPDDTKALRRIFKVLKSNVPFEEHPAPIKDQTGYSFYWVDPDSGRVKLLQKYATPELRQMYWTAVEDLVHDIAEELTEMASAGDDPGPQGAAGQGTVYLAEVASDMRDHREELRRELTGMGYEVLPADPIPLTGDDTRATIEGLLARSDFSIHLLGSVYGIVPEMGDESVVALQHDLAAERTGLLRLVWIDPRRSKDGDRQDAFIDRVRSAVGARGSIDIFETPLERFKTAVHDHITKPVEELPAGAPSPAGGGGLVPSVYLVHDAADEGDEALAAIESALLDAGLEPERPFFSDGSVGEDAVREENQATLLSADAALVYHGQGSELWLRQMVREIDRAKGLGRTQPWLATAVWIGAPLSAAKADYRSNRQMVIGGEGVSVADGLRSFIDAIRAGGTAAAVGE